MSSTALEVKAYRPPESRAGTITSWIPLVTPYSMFAGGCTSAFWQQRAGSSIVGWDPGYGILVDTSLSCVPEAVTTWWDQVRLGPNSETVVSIGPLVCPEPDTTVAIREDASSTMVACCPSEYTFSSWASAGTALQCYSVVGPGNVIKYYTNDNKQWGATTLTTNTTTTVLAAHINGWVFAEETGSGECTASKSNNSPETGDGTLSTGDKIGIGIGVGMGVIGLATLAVGLFMIRRARKFHQPQHREEQKQKQEQEQEQEQEQQQQQQTTHNDGSLWNSPSAHPGAHGDIAAGGARYVAPPSELYST